MQLNKLFMTVAATLAVALTTACGGGGSGSTGSTTATPPTPPTPPTSTASYIDKYVGTWTTACLTNPGVNESGKFNFVITKATDSTLNITQSGTRLTGTTCLGTLLPSLFPTQTASGTYVDTVNGTDRFNSVSANSMAGKTAFKITVNTLRAGNELGAKDSAGYPVINDADTNSFIDYFRQ